MAFPLGFSEKAAKIALKNAVKISAYL